MMGESAESAAAAAATAGTTDKRRVIVILQKARLETVKVGKEYQLLNCDDHHGILKKFNRDVADMRPDIAHQCLLTLLDSPLNKSGHLQVFVHTEKNVLIEVNPHTRIPRTYKRFAGLMVQLLHKLSIRATDGPDRLLKVIKNPVTDHLPPGCRKIGFSFDAKRTVQFSEYIKTLPPTDPVAFIVGAFAHGEIDEDYCEESIAISEYPLSASVACGKLCAGFEDLWGIL